MMIDMHIFNKNMDWNTMCDSAKLEHKLKLESFNILYQMYQDKFNTDYYISCNVKKDEARFWLKKINGYNGSPDHIISFSQYLNPNSSDDRYMKKLYKKNKFFIPLCLNKSEDEFFISFYIKVKHLNSALTETREKCECNVCLELKTEYYIDNPFLCNHNDVCIDCNNKIFKTSNSCCICRANHKSIKYV
jgi:hypothetical protein